MKLIGSKTSPYTRKVRVILAEKNLACEFVEENVWAADTKMAQFNPLVKVPALLLDDGEPLYDSAVIAEYLDALPGGAKFIPSDARERAVVRRAEALGDGICDAGILLRLERQREAARQDPGWIARQQSKVEAGIAAASRAVATGKAGTITLGDITLACALLWVDFRMPDMGWRKDAALKAWIERLETRPSFATTKPG
jgi:glutathione S-transferase